MYLVYNRKKLLTTNTVYKLADMQDFVDYCLYIFIKDNSLNSRADYSDDIG